MKRILTKLWRSLLGRVELLTTGQADKVGYEIKMRLSGFDLGPVSLEELGLTEERSVFYADSGGPDLVRVLASLNIQPGDRAVDFGCGKGGAMLSLGKYPFEEIVGIDLSQRLLDVAAANGKRAGLSNLRLVQCDAATFTDLDKVTHIYMYNPFPPAVVRAVLANVRSSLARVDRTLVLIYKNPIDHEGVLASGIFPTYRDVKYQDKSPPWDLFRIYTHGKGDALP